MSPIVKPVRKHSFIHPTAIVGGPPQCFIEKTGLWFKPDVHPTVYVGPFTTIDTGTERKTTVGQYTYIMGHVNIGHDAIVGSDCDIADSAVICGFAEIGNCARIGVSAIILPYRKVGEGAHVGAGAVVTKDVPAFETWAGNPARRIDANPVPFTERDEQMTAMEILREANGLNDVPPPPAGLGNGEI